MPFVINLFALFHYGSKYLNRYIAHSFSQQWKWSFVLSTLLTVLRLFYNARATFFFSLNKKVKASAIPFNNVFFDTHRRLLQRISSFSQGMSYVLFLKQKEKIGHAKSKQNLTQWMRWSTLFQPHLLCHIPMKTSNTLHCIILHVPYNACFQKQKQVMICQSCYTFWKQSWEKNRGYEKRSNLTEKSLASRKI